MPLTPYHIGLNILAYYLFSTTFPIEFTFFGCVMLALAELIDLDHLWSKPIYHPRRSSFSTHFFHKNWIIVSVIATGMLFVYPLTFIGAGLLSHFILDYVHTKYWMRIAV